MSVGELVVETLRVLPTPQQQQVLEFARSLAAKEKKPALLDPRGMAADLGCTVSAEDIDEARREMWGNFPREDLP